MANQSYGIQVSSKSRDASGVSITSNGNPVNGISSASVKFRVGNINTVELNGIAEGIDIAAELHPKQAGAIDWLKDMAANGVPEANALLGIASAWIAGPGDNDKEGGK